MKIENRQQLLMVLTIAAVALLAGDKLIFTPLTNLWKKRAQEIAALRTQVANGAALVKREQAIRSHWDEMRTNTLTNNQSLAQEQVLKALVGWSQESGASINGTAPQWKSDADDYKTLVCRVDASGSLWTLSRFLFDLEKGPVALKLESMDLSSHDNDGQQLTLSLQVSGLVLTPTGK
jgi:Tfp pilus assembly protein PilO